MKLKRGDRFGLPYHTQLKIYATCLNYGEESDAQREMCIRDSFRGGDIGRWRKKICFSFI